MTARFADNGQYASSSSGPDGETAGTYAVTGPDAVTISNWSGSHAYHFRVNNAMLTLLTSSQGVDETCNLPNQQ